MNISAILSEHRLHINSRLEQEVVTSFCSTTTQGGRKRLLQDWFQGYIYAATLGISKDKRVPFAKGEKVQKAQWSSNYLNQYEFLLSHLLTRTDILVELNLLSSMADDTEAQTSEILLKTYLHEGAFNQTEFYKQVFEKLKNICDEFMNGGLEYLAEKKSNGSNFNDRLETLVEFLEPE